MIETPTSYSALDIWNAVQDENTYTVDSLWEQIWEAPYSWFGLKSGIPKQGSEILGEVWEYEGDTATPTDYYTITRDDLKKATIDYYMRFVLPSRKDFQSIQSYLSDLDANDVDCILQLACFKEIRYS